MKPGAPLHFGAVVIRAIVGGALVLYAYRSEEARRVFTR
ncbi:MAG: hypothetical protein JWM53_1187 [bacterium]|nr:hypothetical protein [bacterium]